MEDGVAGKINLIKHKIAQHQKENATTQNLVEMAPIVLVRVFRVPTA